MVKKGLIIAVTILSFFCIENVQATNISYKYDSLGRLVEALYENVGKIIYAHDQAGNILTKTVAASADTDSISDAEEQGPSGNNPGYDGDGNGIPDYQESRTASFQAASGGAYVTLAVPVGQTLAVVRAANNPSLVDSPDGVAFPFGFFEFTIDAVGNGNCTTATLFLPKTAELNTYYKYGPTPDNPALHWYEFLYNGLTGAEIFQDTSQTRVVLHFCDGQRGDGDLAANSQVTDLGGPGQKPVLLYLPLILR